jgi:hypothetical protein
LPSSCGRLRSAHDKHCFVTGLQLALTVPRDEALRFVARVGADRFALFYAKEVLK